jgi:6-pyruvoyltetrahydropterin/6-carboxytetrahydropterin synthase
MMAKLNAFLMADRGRLRCVEVRIEETPTNTVTFDGDPSQVLPPVNRPDPWWLRADMSINDIPRESRPGQKPLAAAAQ